MASSRRYLPTVLSLAIKGMQVCTRAQQHLRVLQLAMIDCRQERGPPVLSLP
jgi:hypothetical protein